jgi:hypothetical protein
MPPKPATFDSNILGKLGQEKIIENKVFSFF